MQPFICKWYTATDCTHYTPNGGACQVYGLGNSGDCLHLRTRPGFTSTQPEGVTRCQRPLIFCRRSGCRKPRRSDSNGQLSVITKQEVVRAEGEGEGKAAEATEVVPTNPVSTRSTAYSSTPTAISSKGKRAKSEERSRLPSPASSGCAPCPQACSCGAGVNLGVVGRNRLT